MPATVTLSTTELVEAVGPSDGAVKLASTSGLFAGYRLFLEGESMEVISLGVDSWVNVRRGVDGTKGVPHASGGTIYIGQPHQFYSQDPTGRPPAVIPVSPYINVVNGSLWFAQGDALPTATRWWQRQTTTHGVGALGVRTTTLDPTSST
ncbi:hypothetical protein [Longimicrobium sp.]|uniref:hypothetical protein n=1 Tax=Longimicrobium sp. TaxID=2029185 RepID=UPI002E2F9DD2|nr:hypothetical protein [Longimicrobium sp.]HEX6038913.1 hypothetical protein [Longimicrobium sp.]